MTGSVTGGTFITLEGPDGAGKSSQIEPLADRIRALGREVVLTREPGGTPMGERIRELLLHGDARDPLTDALLFNAARRQLVADVIGPALARGAVVVCDRYTDSTLAYQGYGAGVSLESLRALADIATGSLRPDRTILLDLSPEAGLRRRAQGEKSEITRFESAEAHDIAFHRRVREGYLELAAADPWRWRVVDADRMTDEVAHMVWAALGDLQGANEGRGS
jgi:dTMP kinase